MLHKLAITYDELLEIYATNGHTVKQPNSVKAIAQALNTVYARVMDSVNDRFNDYGNVLLELQAKVAELQGVIVAQAASTHTQRKVVNASGRMCYCGTLVQGGGPCPTCYAGS